MYNDRTKIQEAYEKVIERDNMTLDEGILKFAKDIKKLNQEWKTVGKDIDSYYDQATEALNKKEVQDKIDTLILIRKNAQEKQKRIRQEMKVHYQAFIDQISRTITTFQGLKGK